MDPTDDRTERKRLDEHIDMLGFVADSEYGIPKKCHCGAGIMNEVRGEEEYDTVPGKRYFTCVNYEDNGLHYRQPWAVAVQEELEKLWKRVEQAEEVIKGVSRINQQIEFLEGQVKTLNEQVEFLFLRIADLERLCFD